MAEESVEEVIGDNEQGLLEQVTDLSFLDSVSSLHVLTQSSVIHNSFSGF